MCIYIIKMGFTKTNDLTSALKRIDAIEARMNKYDKRVEKDAKAFESRVQHIIDKVAVDHMMKNMNKMHSNMNRADDKMDMRDAMTNINRTEAKLRKDDTKVSNMD